MQKTFRITVDGRSYNVLVEDISEPAQPGAPLPASVATVAAASIAPAAPVPATDAAPPTPGSEVAPLAGVVYAIDVETGQAVQPGDRIAIIEAMKMKTFVVAKGAGTVTAIAVRVGDSVEPGQVLLTLG
jgi:biotin carboxyl carrier protein